jgi:FkbM family methyltransferase
MLRNRWITQWRAKILPAPASQSQKRTLKRFRACASKHPESEYAQTFEFVRAHIRSSHSQILQDLFVLHEVKSKRNGFFVEFGAGDGIFLSNTYMLETHHGWAGILAEPAHVHQHKLRAGRRCAIDKRCVWAKTGETLIFNQTPFAELSTIGVFSNRDEHSLERANGERYEVDTVSLTDLLMAHGAPHDIDYLSIDTEGSELDILSAFDWDSYRFGVITVEHNHTAQREKIFELLTAQGYRRKFEAVSDFDDWYVKL